tara:strand:- start:375 stop:1130 length:756 start_codon:yes stop_codon:yes gene_type:complete
MANNNINLNDRGAMDMLSMGVIAIIGFIVVIIVVYVVFGVEDDRRPSSQPPATTKHDGRHHHRRHSNSGNNNLVGSASNNKKDERLPADFIYEDNTTGDKQVFNISDNIFTYDDAEAVCKAYGGELATYEQLVDAYKKGANWCNYGWTKGQMILYPIQPEYYKKMQENDPERQNDCGQVGINGGYYKNKNSMFGVNCYGYKRAPQGGERHKTKYLSDKDRELRRKINEFRKKLKSFKLQPFNEDKWSSCSN